MGISVFTIAIAVVGVLTGHQVNKSGSSVRTPTRWGQLLRRAQNRRLSFPKQLFSPRDEGRDFFQQPFGLVQNFIQNRLCFLRLGRSELVVKSLKFNGDRVAFFGRLRLLKAFVKCSCFGFHAFKTKLRRSAAKLFTVPRNTPETPPFPATPVLRTCQTATHRPGSAGPKCPRR